MAKTREELKNIKIEVDSLRKSITGDNVGEMKIKFTELEDRVDDIAKESAQGAEALKISEVLKKKIEDREDYEQYSKFASEDQLDQKIQTVLEKLKNENQLLWKETVELAEK